MIKSEVTEFFLEYFEKNRINTAEISEKIGIDEEKLKRGYEKALTSEEFLELCSFLGIHPEMVRDAIKGKSMNKSKAHHP